MICMALAAQSLTPTVSAALTPMAIASLTAIRSTIAESWQEVLAAHICEPVRNFGVGGYSVYQSYLRLKREEVRNPAKYIIFNIFEDDHFRNLSSWQNINSGKNAHNITPTRPFVNVNPDTGALIERDNPCPTRDSVYNLCDLEWVCANFEHDFRFGDEDGLP